MRYVNCDNYEISQITLGTAQLSQQYGIANVTGKPNILTQNQILELAKKSGINTFDTAPTYGDSEEILGSFFSTTSFLKFPVVVTKIPKISDTIIFSNLYNEIKSSVISSSKHLRMNKIPICLLHDVKDMASHEGQIVECMQKLKDDDLVGKIGVSIYTPDDVKNFLKIGIFDVIQIPLNLFDTRLIDKGLIEKLRNKGIFIFARSIFLQGLFFLDFNKLPPFLKPVNESLKELSELSSEIGSSVPQLALTFVRDIPGISSLILGIETVNQLENNLEFISSPPISNKNRVKILDLFRSMPEELINPSLWNTPT